MKTLISKFLLIIFIYLMAIQSDRIEKIIELEAYNHCLIFNSFNKQSSPIVLKSLSPFFDKCFQHINKENLSVVDRNNESKIIEELSRQSQIPSHNILPIGNLLIPTHLITEETSIENLLPEGTLKVTKIETGEITWERKTTFTIFQRYSKEFIYLAVLVLSIIFVLILFFPINITTKRIVSKQVQRQFFKEATYLARSGNYSEGIDKFIEAASMSSCKKTQKESLKKLHQLKLKIGVYDEIN